MAKLIITADDYGLSEEVNKGIRECIKKGAVTSVQVLMNLVSENELKKLVNAIDLAEVKFKNRCGIGLHFNTTFGKAMLANPDSSLINKSTGTNTFYTIRDIDHKEIKLNDLRVEFKSQLYALAEFLGGYDKIDSISSHHNFHFFSVCLLKAMLKEAEEHCIPYRSPVQWRSGKQEIDTKKYKVFCRIENDGLKTLRQATKHDTKLVLGNALEGEFLGQQRGRVILSGSKSPLNASGQWYGHASYDCLMWIFDQMKVLQSKMDQLHPGKHYISEIYTHIASGEGNVAMDLTYPMSDRVNEYNMWMMYKTRKFLEPHHNENSDVQLCSYRKALEGHEESTTFVENSEGVACDLT